MSDRIPFHLQEEIMKRLPVKSLVQFRSVSKAWKSLIDSSEFIAAHSLRRHTQPQHLVVPRVCEVMVYTLNSGKWRNVPAERIGNLYRSVVTDRFIYWNAELETHKIITSFDLTSESFEVIDLPDSLAHHGAVHISKLRESPALLQYSEEDHNCSTVWIMDHGDQRSFKKLFTIKTPHESIVGFRKNGVPIMQVTDDDDNEQLGKLVVYEPNSEHDNVLEICPTAHLFFVDSVGNF